MVVTTEDQSCTNSIKLFEDSKFYYTSILVCSSLELLIIFKIYS